MTPQYPLPDGGKGPAMPDRDPANLPVPPDGAACGECGQGLWHPDSKTRGTCERCRHNKEAAP